MTEHYFLWLCSLVGNVTDPLYSYWELCRLLHNRQFVALMTMDQNRALDGQGLRSRYIRQTNQIIDQESPCTVFQMMVGLADRMNFMLSDDSGEDRTGWCFMQMLQNLGLLNYTDASFLGMEWTPDEVYSVVNRLLQRCYESDGTGGLFVIRGVNWDVRRLDLWYQMETWLQQNCPIEVDEDL